MSTKVRRSKTTDFGTPEWIRHLAHCVDLIGTSEFPESLVNSLKSLVDVDYSEAFAYSQNEKPVCLFHTFDADQQVVFVDDYLKGPYLLDPFFKACGRKVKTGLYRMQDIAPDRFYQSEYYRSYYIQTGLSEEICFTFYLPNEVAVVISLMRAGESPRFSAREFRILQSVTPIVVSMAKRHWHDASRKFDSATALTEKNNDPLSIEHKVSELFSQRITPRETQVVAQVLEGHSSDSIARSLGITVGTVRIHRRNIYAKLQISSQQELFSIFFSNITAGR